MNDPIDPSDEPVLLKDPALAAILTWLLPGLGHWYQGRKFKAVVFGASVIGLYVVGMWIGKSHSQECSRAC